MQGYEIIHSLEPREPFLSSFQKLYIIQDLIKILLNIAMKNAVSSL
jgi:hypothetical protein